MSPCLVWGGARRHRAGSTNQKLSHRSTNLKSGVYIGLTGDRDDGEVRALEIAGHPFYVATLFQFERSASRENAGAHPVVRADLEAVLKRSANDV